uniref:Uncharacterized protein n=1 Tax=Chromera velia CCMP2878 TaxID=1169474 RepID=A0A0G4FQW1_9ALVE|eukprot:Cvel_3610.t1-p1 / transcript=Cvel_3610.t1 / gene=Cvel_3610 / organism=Chromera_velia_CCMP2878 / gene_product=hypothetical protein / transcript_product=hypothetical protein / location=Cvel_scaffold148:46297-47193(+) / protein_length=299 / sequence_SO=supercontig / SO=protein_coding / is_pseudo=false
MATTYSLRSCAGGTAITLLVLALLAYAFWAREPVICATISWDEPMVRSSEVANGQLNLSFKVRLDILNRNWYGVRVKDLKLGVYHEAEDKSEDVLVASWKKDSIDVLSGGWFRSRRTKFPKRGLATAEAVVSADRTPLFIAEAVHKCAKYQVTPFDLKVSGIALGYRLRVVTKVNAACEILVAEDDPRKSDGFALTKGEGGSCSDDKDLDDDRTGSDLDDSDSERVSLKEYFFGGRGPSASAQVESSRVSEKSEATAEEAPAVLQGRETREANKQKARVAVQDEETLSTTFDETEEMRL